MKKVLYVMIPVLLIAIYGCDPVEVELAYWISTDKHGNQVEKDLSCYKIDSEDPYTIRINLNEEKQTVEGFGGAVNEVGWDALSVLADNEKEKVIEELFHPEHGLRLNRIRVPIGSSDFALVRYSHNETPDDFLMENFSIERDFSYLIPYIKAAMIYQPRIPVWGSAWTPPTWMKSNNDFDRGKMRDDPEVYGAYALYLKKFVETYRAEGINLFEVAVQNEPKILEDYPTCGWDGNQYFEFVKNHLGPALKDMDIPVGIMLGTFNFGNEYSDYIEKCLNDTEINAYVTSVGYQWNGIDMVPKTKVSYPNKRLVQTETECGNWHWNGVWNRLNPTYVFNAKKAQNDYFYATYTFDRIQDYFEAGVNTYYLWNIVLDQYGLNNNQEKPWPQNAAVVIDRDKKKAVFPPMYHAFWHFSHFIDPGAKYLSLEGEEALGAAFKNPDSSVIVVLQNKEDTKRKITVQIDTIKASVELGAHTFNTLKIKL